MWQEIVAQLAVALSKTAALITSQRTITTLVGVVIIIAMGQGIIATLVGGEAWEIPDEEALTARLTEVLGVIAALITAIVGTLSLFKNWQQSVITDPPTLYRDWTTRYSQLLGSGARDPYANEGQDTAPAE